MRRKVANKVVISGHPSDYLSITVRYVRRAADYVSAARRKWSGIAPAQGSDARPTRGHHRGRRRAGQGAPDAPGPRHGRPRCHIARVCSPGARMAPSRLKSPRGEGQAPRPRCRAGSFRPPNDRGASPTEGARAARTAPTPSRATATARPGAIAPVHRPRPSPAMRHGPCACREAPHVEHGIAGRIRH